jgi:CubicO group peptidase (beta-lactamase class C family)
MTADAEQILYRTGAKRSSISRPRRIAFFHTASLALISITAAATAQAPPAASAPATDIPTRMQQIVDSFVDAKQFMGTVLVARDGHILLDKGYGDADLEWQIPNSPTTKFRIGSMTKQFTAASIMLLEERGKLNVNDPVKKYMPDAPAAWDKVTIASVLSHTSGIPSFTSFPDYHAKEATPTTPAELVARFRDKPLDFPPGEKWSYSNSGYVLLGYLIEKISGQTYQEFLQQNILTPLAMHDTGYDSNQAIIPRRASGYSPGPNGPENTGYIDMTIPFSAGALYSTTEDLLKWEQALFAGKVVSQASLAKMIAPVKNDYGFGLAIHDESGHKVIEHGGGIEGFNTQMNYYPDDKLVIIVLGNLNGSAPGDIASKLGAVAHGQKVTLVSERKEVTVSPDILKTYVGTYQLAPEFKLNITLEDGKLFVQGTNQPKFPMFAESPTDFFMRVVDAQGTFVKDAGGQVNTLIWRQNGHEAKAARVATETPAAPTTPASPNAANPSGPSGNASASGDVPVPENVLATYTGTYQLTPEFKIAITLENGQLSEQATNQPKVPIYPKSETLFYLKVVDAQIEFVKDAGSKVTGLILHQNGRDLHGERMP